MKTIALDGVILEVEDDHPLAQPPEPMPEPVPTVAGTEVIGVLSDAQASSAKLRDLVRIAADPDVPVTNAKLVRIAKAVGMAPADLFTAASGTS